MIFRRSTLVGGTLRGLTLVRSLVLLHLQSGRSITRLSPGGEAPSDTPPSAPFQGLIINLVSGASVGLEALDCSNKVTSMLFLSAPFQVGDGGKPFPS